MVGHLNVPSLNKDCNLLACINPNIVQDYLIGELGFEGLIFTDAMNMKGLTNDFPDGQASVLALKAGIDILLMPNNTSEAVNAIMAAIEKGELSEKTIKEKCQKVLGWKYDLGVIKPQKEKTESLADLDTETKALNKQIAQRVLTLLKNDDDILPLNPRDSL